MLSSYKYVQYFFPQSKPISTYLYLFYRYLLYAFHYPNQTVVELCAATAPEVKDSPDEEDKNVYQNLSGDNNRIKDRLSNILPSKKREFAPLIYNTIILTLFTPCLDFFF